jgi:hypothetical protein
MEESWTVPDVYLLPEGRDGELAVPHLKLTLLDSGLILDQADGDVVWRGDWGELTALAPVARSVLPDGRDGVVVVVVERARRRRHHFVLATADVVATEAEVRRHAAAHGLRTTATPRAASRALTVAIALAALATLTVLLLSATHVIHF